LYNISVDVGICIGTMSRGNECIRNNSSTILGLYSFDFFFFKYKNTKRPINDTSILGSIENVITPVLYNNSNPRDHHENR